ncbi:MAG TPA: transporter substrate-binding domain-containing protein [Caulobacteraceae bacterium]|jgi:polar amino acid transport system substrate-binding protein|nr:transporter substrate-binding domain-containing protein [Caulobacteraceae bacterium]
MTLHRRAAILGLTGAVVLGRKAAAATAGGSQMTGVDPAVVAELAPSGRLRAAINLANVVLAQRDPVAGAKGVSVDLARELGRRLGTPVDLITYEEAGKVIPAQGADHWDVAFLAVDPERAAVVSFTAPYVYIDGTYMVREGSPFHAVADVDAAGVKVAVAQGAAYDLALTRQLKHATLVRERDTAASVEVFKAGGAEALGGIRPVLVEVLAPGLRILPDSFTRVEQAMVIPQGRPAAARYLAAFIEEMKASGFVRAGLDRSGQTGALVADPAK